MAAGPARTAAPIPANSQPEPMIEVSDAHVAPMSPISRLRPMSPGLEAVAPTGPVSVAMIEFPSRSRGAGHPPIPGGHATGEWMLHGSALRCLNTVCTHRTTLRQYRRDPCRAEVAGSG